MKDLPGSFEGATLACCSQLSNISHELLQQQFAKLPFEKSILFYSQKLWISLWMIHLDSPLKWRGVKVFVIPLNFYIATISIKNNEML